MADIYESLFGKPVTVTNIKPEALENDDLLDALRILQTYGDPDEMKNKSIVMDRDENGRFRYAGKTNFHIVDDLAHRIPVEQVERSVAPTWPPEGCDYDGVPYPAGIQSSQANDVYAPKPEVRYQGGFWLFRFLTWYFGLSPMYSIPLAIMALALILVIIPVK